MSYTPEQLREWADEGSLLSSQQSDVLRAHADALEEIERLKAKLTVVEEREELYRRALHDICEEWAGAECGMPITAQEAYAIALAKRMYRLAALKGAK